MKPLTKEEMKQIIGGNALISDSNSGCGPDCTGTCTTNSTGDSGTCHANSGGKCFCVAVY